MILGRALGDRGLTCYGSALYCERELWDLQRRRERAKAVQGGFDELEECWETLELLQGGL